MVGGTAVEAIEGWILALLGERDSESHSRPKIQLEQRHDIGTTEKMVAVTQVADLDRTPADAVSLRSWLERAEKCLTSEVFDQ